MSNNLKKVRTPIRSLSPTKDSRSYLKRLYHDFWNNSYFRRNWQAEQWFNHSTEMQTFSVLKSVLWKLWLENKITELEKENLTKMLESPDRENVFVAITIMYQKAGRKMRFGRR